MSLSTQTVRPAVPSSSGSRRAPGPRIAGEKRTIDAMLAMRCRDLHGTRRGLCLECARLRDYAHRRLDTCPFQEAKPVCNRCAVHCYSVPMGKRVREVMRYAGPRMTLRHPWLAVRHVLDKLRAVPRLGSRRRSGLRGPVRDGAKGALE